MHINVNVDGDCVKVVNYPFYANVKKEGVVLYNAA